jgi:aspartate aminotransferase-like enzyme
MSGTGHAGMEATIANLVEPGETVLVGNKGIWGARVADLAARYGANVVEITTGGEPRSFSLNEIKSAVETHKPALLFLCQGESSMGVLSLSPLLFLPSSLLVRATLFPVRELLCPPLPLIPPLFHTS